MDYVQIFLSFKLGQILYCILGLKEKSEWGFTLPGGGVAVRLRFFFLNFALIYCIILMTKQTITIETLNYPT